MPLYYSLIFPYNGYDFKDGRIHWLSEILSWADLQDFFDRMKAHGFTTTREAAGDIASMEQLYMLIAGNPRVYAIENDDLKVEIVPNLGARMLRVIHKATGECVTAWNVKQGLFFPFNGGLEDRVGGSTVPFGWVEPGVIKYQTESSFATLQNTINGYSVFREIALDGDKPIIIIRTTVSNPSSKPIDCRLREHVEYDLGNLLSTKIFFKSKSGASVNVDMNKVIAGMREGIHYYDQNAPKGEWTLSGSKGLQVVEKFDDSLVDFAWVYSYPDTLNEVETEIWINNKTLAPGESVIFERSFEITQTPSASY